MKQKIKKIIINFCMILLIGIIGYSGFNLVQIYNKYHKGTKEYESVENLFKSNDNKEMSTDEIVLDKDKPVTEKEKESINDNSSNFNWNYSTLKNVSNDAIGYIRNSSGLNYPIVQGVDNEYYLHHLIDGTYNFAGTLFVDYRLDNGLDSDNAIIYGHCMKNGSMFGMLYKFNNPSYAESNSLFNVYIGNKHYIYKIFAAYKADSRSTVYRSDFTNEKKFLNYINACKTESNIHLMDDYAFSKEDHIITLTTCTNDDDIRQIVQLVRIGKEK